MDEDTPRRRMTGLARTFPTMGGILCVEPFDPEGLDRWAARFASVGEWSIACFLLDVWDSFTDWEAGRFDFMEA